MAKAPAKGTMQGRILSEEHKTAIVQTFALTHNKEETGRICSVSAKTVRAVLAQRTTKEVQEARARASVDTAERVHDKVNEVLDNITPEKLQDASASQLAVVGGIFIDKLPVLERFRSELVADSGGVGGIPLPEDMKAMVKMVGDKVRAIDVMRIELRDPEMERQLTEARDLLDRAQREAEAPEVIEAEFEVIDLDNPGEE